MNQWVFVVAAVLGGICISPQGAINAILGQSIGRLQAGMVSFAVGFTTLVVSSLLFQRRYPGSWQRLGEAPAYAFTGGALGAVIVVTTLVAVPKIGATATLVAIVLGQVAISLLMDHFGWFGLPRVAVEPRRLLGVLFLLAALPLVMR